ncbi:MAG: DUF6036 family nucleotidyltransferase [Acidaminobacteraceae bacterium]
MLKNRELLIELLHDADEFANFKKIICPPIYFLGGSGCVLGNYLERATLDLDFVDIDYDASVGKVFRLFDRFDMLDTYVTPVADGFEKRAKVIEGFSYLKFYTLSKEDIIVSKLGRYSDKDKEDIDELIKDCDKELLENLIASIIDKENFSERIKEEFKKNVKKVMEKYYV